MFPPAEARGMEEHVSLSVEAISVRSEFLNCAGGLLCLVHCCGSVHQNDQFRIDGLWVVMVVGGRPGGGGDRLVPEKAW